MCDGDTERGLVTRATQGDRVALQQLMALHASQLSDFIARKLPPSRRAHVDADDILQQTFVDVFRDIKRFEPRSGRSFLGWLKTIADHRIQDAVKAVHDVLRQLPDDCRQAVALRLLEGKSLEETAAALSRSPRAVQGLVDRAKKKLRAVLVRLSLYR